MPSVDGPTGTNGHPDPVGVIGVSPCVAECPPAKRAFAWADGHVDYGLACVWPAHWTMGAVTVYRHDHERCWWVYVKHWPQRCQLQYRTLNDLYLDLRADIENPATKRFFDGCGNSLKLLAELETYRYAWVGPTPTVEDLYGAEHVDFMHKLEIELHGGANGEVGSN